MTVDVKADGAAHCRRCPRLVGFLDQVRRQYPQYYARPVPSFGVARPRLLIIGLAPGMHGANASGRPFTGDHAGLLLYRTLYETGLASAPESLSADDGLELHQCRITNAVRCLPPQNKPNAEEMRNCNDFLRAELDQMHNPGVMLALGRLAHNAALRALGLRQSAHVFAHGAEHPMADGRVLVDSYHCSRYNTQTGRLTQEMFRSVLCRARELMATQSGAGDGI